MHACPVTSVRKPRHRGENDAFEKEASHFRPTSLRLILDRERSSVVRWRARALSIEHIVRVPPVPSSPPLSRSSTSIHRHHLPPSSRSVDLHLAEFHPAFPVPFLFFSPLPPLPLTGVDEDKGHPVSREFDVLPVQRFLGGTASSERYAASYSSFVFVSRHVDPPPSPSLPVAFLALVAL